MEKTILDRLAENAGGTIETVGALPDGSGFAMMTLPLPKDHWLTAEGHNEPPMPLRIGTDDPSRAVMVEQVRSAARYAVRASTDNGKIVDFDPDAMVQNMIVGLLGYFTPDGTSQL